MTYLITSFRLKCFIIEEMGRTIGKMQKTSIQKIPTLVRKNLQKPNIETQLRRYKSENYIN